MCVCVWTCPPDAKAPEYPKSKTLKPTKPKTTTFSSRMHQQAQSEMEQHTALKAGSTMWRIVGLSNYGYDSG